MYQESGKSYIKTSIHALITETKPDHVPHTRPDYVSSNLPMYTDIQDVVMYRYLQIKNSH